MLTKKTLLLRSDHPSVFAYGQFILTILRLRCYELFFSHLQSTRMSGSM